MARRIATGGLCKKQLELPASSLIRTAHGSEAPTRTPTASSATTSPKALISVPLETRSWPTSSANSTSGRSGQRQQGDPNHEQILDGIRDCNSHDRHRSDTRREQDREEERPRLCDCEGMQEDQGSGRPLSLRRKGRGDGDV